MSGEDEAPESDSVWRGLARMEAELNDPDEDETAVYKPSDVESVRAAAKKARRKKEVPSVADLDSDEALEPTHVRVVVDKGFRRADAKRRTMEDLKPRMPAEHGDGLPSWWLAAVLVGGSVILVLLHTFR